MVFEREFFICKLCRIFEISPIIDVSGANLENNFSK